MHKPTKFKLAALYSVIFYSVVQCSYTTTAQAEVFIVTQGLSQNPFNPCKLRVAQAYQRLDIQAEFRYMPMRRGLDQANKGYADADLCRIPLIEKHYPNLVRVDAIITQMTLLPVTLYDHPDIEDFNDLNNYILGSVRGVQAVELSFPDASVRYEEDLHDLFRMLEKGVIDVVLVAEVFLNQFLSDKPDLQIRIHRDNAKIYPLYHYVHKKHQQMVPKLASELSKPIPLINL